MFSPDQQRLLSNDVSNYNYIHDNIKVKVKIRARAYILSTLSQHVLSPLFSLYQKGNDTPTTGLQPVYDPCVLWGAFRSLWVTEIPLSAPDNAYSVPSAGSGSYTGCKPVVGVALLIKKT